MDFMSMSFDGFRAEADPDRKHPDFAVIRNHMAASASPGGSDLRQFSSPRHQQAHSSTCAANATIKGLELKRIQKYTLESEKLMGFERALEYGRSKHVDLSRLALYHLARELMDPPETNLDKGTYISLCADVLRRFGVCREAPDPSKPDDTAYWPFDLTKIFVSPGWLQMRQAYVHKIDAWHKIYSEGEDRVHDVIQSLSAGSPVVYGTVVDEHWQSYDGTPLGLKSGKVLGGHATILVGWDPSGFFWGENSWGNDWGPDDGFYKIRPEVIQSSDSSDFIVMSGGWEEWTQKVS